MSIAYSDMDSCASLCLPTTLLCYVGARHQSGWEPHPYECKDIQTKHGHIWFHLYMDM